MMALAQRAMRRARGAYAPQGYNVGFNQGRVAGAGVEDHIHMHVVPRWGGDTNFMPVLGRHARHAAVARGELRGARRGLR